jgi:hypothetical protein
MSANALASILTAAQKCLDSAKLVSDIRAVVQEHVPDYFPCLDVSLSQQMELISGLMTEYTLQCEGYVPEFFDIGKEPLSHEDALCFLNDFLEIARNAVRKASKDSTVLFLAHEIGLRAQTFAALLQEANDNNASEGL